jgi:dihydropyrimidinase
LNLDLLVRGGTVVTSSSMLRADLAVVDGQIVGLGDYAEATAREIIDASGRLVMPGFLDVHVHPVYLDDFSTCSEIGLRGGVTTILYMIFAPKGHSLVSVLKEQKAQALAQASADFGFHGCVFDVKGQIGEVAEAVALGVSSFKMFMAYGRAGWAVTDDELFMMFEELAKNSALALVHAENGSVIDYLERKFAQAGLTGPQHYRPTHPEELEAEGVCTAILLAKLANCSLYLVHMSSREALVPIRQARASGQRVYAEACVHHLTLTDEEMARWGAYAKVGPPLRDQDDIEALWQGLADGTLQVISSDHAPKRKDLEVAKPIHEVSFGLPGLETLVPVALDEAVTHGRLPLTRMVALMSENPARIFGLYPTKGTLQPGSDADIVVYDPYRSLTIRGDDLHSKAHYTLYEGRKVLGWPEVVIRRGEVVVRDGQFLGRPGQGRFLARGAIYDAPVETADP